jgi:hypothetical protein
MAIQQLHDWNGTPRRLLGDGRQACVEELTFGRGRICIGKADAFFYDIGF